MKLCPKDQLLPGKRAVYASHNHYHGWTGYNHFGVITCYRYYGWHVTCWATVEVYSNRYFFMLSDAIDELSRLMDKADRLGELAHSPVNYMEMPERPLTVQSALIVTKERFPYESPANRERQILQYSNCNADYIRRHLVAPKPVTQFKRTSSATIVNLRIAEKQK